MQIIAQIITVQGEPSHVQVTCEQNGKRVIIGECGCVLTPIEEAWRVALEKAVAWLAVGPVNLRGLGSRCGVEAVARI